MTTNQYQAIAAFIIRLIALGLFIMGIGTVVYWLLFTPRIMEAASPLVWQIAITSGISYLAGGVVLFALSRPLGRLIGYGL